MPRGPGFMKPCRTALVVYLQITPAFFIDSRPRIPFEEIQSVICHLSSVIAQRRPITCSTRQMLACIELVEMLFRACREAQGRPVRRATLAQGRPSHLCASAPYLRKFHPGEFRGCVHLRFVCLLFAPLRLCVRFCLSLLLALR